MLNFERQESSLIDIQEYSSVSSLAYIIQSNFQLLVCLWNNNVLKFLSQLTEFQTLHWLLLAAAGWKFNPNKLLRNIIRTPKAN